METEIRRSKREANAREMRNIRAAVGRNWVTRNYHVPASEVTLLAELMNLLALPQSPREAQRVSDAGDRWCDYRRAAIATVVEFARTYSEAKRGGITEDCIQPRRRSRPHNARAEVEGDVSNSLVRQVATDTSGPASAPQTDALSVWESADCADRTTSSTISGRRAALVPSRVRPIRQAEGADQTDFFVRLHAAKREEV